MTQFEVSDDECYSMTTNTVGTCKVQNQKQSINAVGGL